VLTFASALSFIPIKYLYKVLFFINALQNAQQNPGHPGPPRPPFGPDTFFYSHGLRKILESFNNPLFQTK
jgi:hypothetical protein